MFAFQNKSKELLGLIEDCIEICNNKLDYFKEYSDKNDECKTSHIKEIILPEMEELTQIIKSKKLPSKEKRYSLSFAYAFKTWCWNIQNPSELYLLLLKINDLYKEL